MATDESRNAAQIISFNQLVARNITTLRTQLGMTQEALGKLLEHRTGRAWSKVTVNAAERSGFAGGRTRRFDADDLYALADVLDCPLTRLLLPIDNPAVVYTSGDPESIEFAAFDNDPEQVPLPSIPTLDARDALTVLFGDETTELRADYAATVRNLYRKYIADEAPGLATESITEIGGQRRLREWLGVLDDMTAEIRKALDVIERYGKEEA